MFCEIISEQHEDCCNKQIPDEYMSWCFSEFTHGYMILGESEEKNFRGRQFFLKAFVLFEYRKYEQSRKMIRGKVICCNKINKGLGRKFLDCITHFALKHKVKRWIIYASAYEKLIAYYQGYGFEKHIESEVPDGRRKTILMLMYFGEDEDLYDYYEDDGSCFDNPNIDEENFSSSDECDRICQSLYRI